MIGKQLYYKTVDDAVRFSGRQVNVGNHWLDEAMMILTCSEAVRSSKAPGYGSTKPNHTVLSFRI